MEVLSTVLMSISCGFDATYITMEQQSTEDKFQLQTRCGDELCVALFQWTLLQIIAHIVL